MYKANTFLLILLDSSLRSYLDGFGSLHGCCWIFRKSRAWYSSFRVNMCLIMGKGVMLISPCVHGQVLTPFGTCLN